MPKLSEIATKKALKALSRLLKPTDETISLLKEINAKLDAQQTSKLMSELNLISKVRNSNISDDTLEYTIHTLSETSEYFKIMTIMSTTKLANIYSGFKNVVKLIIKGNPFFGEIWDTPLKLSSEITNYLNLYLLSEIGVLICMLQRGYSKNILENKFNSINSLSWLDKDFLEFFSVAIYYAHKMKRIPDDIPFQTVEHNVNIFESNLATNFFTRFVANRYKPNIKNLDIAIKSYKKYFVLLDHIFQSKNTKQLIFSLSENDRNIFQ
jgi:hypothetical protein